MSEELELVPIPDAREQRGKYLPLCRALEGAGLEKAIKISMADYPKLVSSTAVQNSLQWQRFHKDETLRSQSAGDRAFRIIWRRKRANS